MKVKYELLLTDVK